MPDPQTPPESPDALLLGCGDLGSRVGLLLAARGHRVTGVRRRADRVPAPIVPLGADLTREVPALPAAELLCVALTARPRTEESYRATYVEGLARALDALPSPPRRAVLVSSTAVFGEVGAGAVTDETSPAEPSDGPGRVLLEAERLFAERVPGGCVLRCSGLYGGPGPSRFVEWVRRGEGFEQDRWTNRIHRDDAAAAVVHLLTAAEPPPPLLVGTDDEPVLRNEVAAYVAGRVGCPAPGRPDPGSTAGRRLSNRALRATGWRPTYPTYREGYADIADPADPADPATGRRPPPGTP